VPATVGRLLNFQGTPNQPFWGLFVTLEDSCSQVHGFHRFEWLVKRGPQKGTLIFYVFDLLSLDGKDLRQLPLVKRKQRLERLIKGHPRLLYVDHVEREGLAMFAGALTLGPEGVVGKDAQSPYVEGPGVTRFWLKVKNRNYQRKEPVEFRTRGKT
jgi:ATP-dependent DNA ligase